MQPASDDSIRYARPSFVSREVRLMMQVHHQQVLPVRAQAASRPPQRSTSRHSRSSPRVVTAHPLSSSPGTSQGRACSKAGPRRPWQRSIQPRHWPVYAPCLSSTARLSMLSTSQPGKHELRAWIGLFPMRSTVLFGCSASPPSSHTKRPPSTRRGAETTWSWPRRRRAASPSFICYL